ncbi:MAG: hypothetical protein Q8M54_01635 [Desulfobaccales bacterium]|nr:hypothetical protein [Desulfobaccales bacterium]
MKKENTHESFEETLWQDLLLTGGIANQRLKLTPLSAIANAIYLAKTETSQKFQRIEDMICILKRAAFGGEISISRDMTLSPDIGQGKRYIFDCPGHELSLILTA